MFSVVPFFIIQLFPYTIDKSYPLFRGGEDLGGRGRGVRGHVAAGAGAHGPGQPLLLQEQGGRGQVAGGGDIQVSHR